MITYLQAAVIGLLQGVTELFPVSSLGHSVLVPALLGGSWQHLVTESSTGTSEQSPYLAFIVALHVATALALLVYFRRDWVRVIAGFVRSLGPSLRARRVVVADADQRLAWLIVVATIPVGVTGLLLEHTFRTLFAKPLAAAVFLTVNGGILLAGELLRRRAWVEPEVGDLADRADLAAADGAPELVGAAAASSATTAMTAAPGHRRPVRRLATLEHREAAVVGVFQTTALLAGISRSGVAMVGGLVRGLSHADAARFSFMLATPVILAAGLLKVPTLFGPAGDGMHGQVVLGFAVAGCSAYASVRWLTRYFQTRTLTPFAVYCLVAGGLCIARFA